jgi:ABC-type phosphate transport system substrate-binding protein
MRIISKITVMAAAAVAIAGVSLGPALADPPSGTTPVPSDVVGVGAQTTQGVMDAIAANYDATNPVNKLYSWDAVNPTTGATGDTIITKGSSSSDMTCAIARPDGSSAGIDAMAATVSDGGYPCIDYARSSSPPSSTSPAGLVWVGFGKDAVSWVTNATTTGAPASLTAAQLNAIYSCRDRTWASVGGTSTAMIVPALPQSSSGTRSFFLAAIGNPALGSCVVNGSINVPNDPYDPVLLEENTAVSAADASGNYYTGNAYFFANNANALFPYSVADWIAQQPAPAGGGYATASFASTGVTQPQKISGVSPITAGSPDTISTAFTTGTATKVFTRLVYNVMPNAGTASAPAIPAGPLTTIFGSKGVVCGDTSIIESYGFLPLGGLCGTLADTGAEANTPPAGTESNGTIVSGSCSTPRIDYEGSGTNGSTVALKFFSVTTVTVPDPGPDFTVSFYIWSNWSDRLGDSIVIKTGKADPGSYCVQAHETFYVECAQNEETGKPILITHNGSSVTAPWWFLAKDGTSVSDNVHVSCVTGTAMTKPPNGQLRDIARAGRSPGGQSR